MSISLNLKNIHDRIAAAAARVGRDPESVRLVAVSKTKPASMIEDAALAGQLLFGENYVQEFIAKAQEVREKVEWHFIGALQTNKVKYLAGIVTLIHSVDRLSLAQEIDKQWGKRGMSCDILIEVNLAGEESKAGTTEGDLIELVRAASRLPHLRIKGLMTLPPFFDDPERVRPYFRRLRELSQSVGSEGIPNVEMKELSMGMSGDFEAAVEEGATLVRVGTAIFGGR